MTDSPLLVDRRGGVLTLTLNRPQRRNALDGALLASLTTALDEHHAGTRAIVLRGAGGCFSSGGDVSSMPGPDQGLLGPASRLRLIHGVVDRLRRHAAPSVAVVDGFAVGAAWGLALGCDVVVADEDAFFSAPFSRRGLAADAGVAWHLTRRLGRHGAAPYLLLAERMPATVAHATGLVSVLAPAGTAHQVGDETAARLAAGALESGAVTRWMADVAEDANLSTFLRDELVGVSLAGHGRDAAEGHRAFAERREAVFAR